MTRTWTFLTAGEARGEAAFTAAVTRACCSEGISVRVVEDHVANAGLFPEIDIDIVPLHRMPASSTDSELVVVCSSLTTSRILQPLRRPGRTIASLEWTWMPWAGTHAHALGAVDRFLFLGPPDLFYRGLAQHGGPFPLPGPIHQRTTCTGWAFPTPRADPTGSPYVFVHLGGNRGSKDTYTSLWHALDGLAKRRGLRVLLRTSPDQAHEAPPHFERLAWLHPADFARTLSGAALVVGHHGAGTASQAAAAGVRLLCLTDGAIFQAREGLDFADREVWAWAQHGVCDSVHGAVPLETLVRRLDALLDAPAPAPQPATPEQAVAALRELAGV